MKSIEGKHGTRWVMEPGDRVCVSDEPGTGMYVYLNDQGGLCVRNCGSEVIAVYPEAANAVCIELKSK